MSDSISEADLFAAVVRDPADVALREVYADWLEQNGDRRAAFVRAHLALAPLPPDYPDRLVRESELSRLRVGLEPDWLQVIEPERAYHHDPDRRWQYEVCDCDDRFKYARFRDDRPMRLHTEPQDTECDSWKRLLDLIEQAAHDGRPELAPFRNSAIDEREILTLPPTIGKLVEVKKLSLWFSNLARIPPEIAGMTSLHYFTPRGSKWLHWLPYEIAHCPQLVMSDLSQRYLYGSLEHPFPFPALAPGTYPAVNRACSVCAQTFRDVGAHRVWISLQVASDVMPLLVNACSRACLDRLPAPPDKYIAGVHRGGEIVWPKPTY
jgi:uncharacterized protein (TIGR02996 family)